MLSSELLRRHFRLLYPAWILLSILLIFAFRHRGDPSSARGEMDSDAAARRAVVLLRSVPGGRYAGYDAAAVAFARMDELGVEPRWIILCDRPHRSGLTAAVVVELSADGSHLLRLRPPLAD